MSKEKGLAQWDIVKKRRQLIEQRLQGLQVKIAFPKSDWPKLEFYKNGSPARLILGDFFQYQPRSLSVFAINSKMACPSFSIASGLPAIGGSCPAAVGMKNGRKDFVCRYCYAGKGNYPFLASESKRYVLLKFIKDALRQGSFVDMMTDAIKHVYKRGIPKKYGWIGERFLRLHDSGDFFSPQYAAAWVEIATRFPKIKFWAPTRIWIYMKQFSVLREASSNFVIRPSGLHLDDSPPVVNGLGPGSAVVDPKTFALDHVYKHDGQNVFICPVYKRRDSASCTDVKCRVCWSKKLPVSYVVH